MCSLPFVFYPGHAERPSLDLANVFTALMPLASEWHNIGALLHIPAGELEAIQGSHPHQQRDCLREMIKTWLRMVQPAPTWEGLVETVEIINAHVAQEICTKYITLV